MSEPDEFDWPEADYQLPDFPLRASFDYFGPAPFDPDIVSRMRQAFGNANRDVLLAVLKEANETIESAVEHSSTTAYEVWLNHEAWLPPLGDSYLLSKEPARLLIESIDLVGVSGFSEQQVCAAVALWCYGEHCGALLRNEHDTQMLEQAALALAEAEFQRGMAESASLSAEEISKRNRAAAEKRHESNKRNKLRGFEIWTSRCWQVQADAEREIARQCHIVQAVAGRWIREFKHAPNAYHAEQSKYAALKRP